MVFYAALSCRHIHETKTIRGSVWLSTRLLGVSVRAWSSNTAVASGEDGKSIGPH